MKTPDSIQEFVEQLRRGIGLRDEEAERILAEVEDHLSEAIKNLKDDGVPEDEAARLSMARFGTPKEVARCFRGEDDMESVGMKRLMFRSSIYMAIASASSFLLGLFAGAQPRLRAGQAAKRVWLEHASSSVQTVWYQIGFGTLVLTLVLIGFGWQEWKRAMSRARTLGI